MLIKFWRMLFGVEVRTMWGADAWLQRGDRVLAYNMAESTDEAATEQCVVLEVIPLMKCATVRTLYPWEFDMQKAKINELQTKLDGHSEYAQMLASACSPEEARSRIDYAKSRLAAAGIGLPKFQVNRLEVIDHGRSQILPGRQYASIRDVKFEVTMAVQDDGCTLKVFLSDLPESERHLWR